MVVTDATASGSPMSAPSCIMYCRRCGHSSPSETEVFVPRVRVVDLNAFAHGFREELPRAKGTGDSKHPAYIMSIDTSSSVQAASSDGIRTWTGQQLGIKGPSDQRVLIVRMRPSNDVFSCTAHVSPH